MKDNFSKQADLYAKFRPSYPASLIDTILSLVTEKKLAWDCATGNGQIAKMLSPHFDQVVATDISSRQLAKAPQIANVNYQVGSAEKTAFPNQTVDLITVGQAIHWFNHQKFIDEAIRVTKPGGIIAIFGYPLLTTKEPLNERIKYFYRDMMGSYWDAERKHLDDRLARIPFPFERITLPCFEQRYRWTFEELLGYLRTWSSVQHFIKRNGRSPVDLFSMELKQAWGPMDTQEVIFEILTLVGRVD